MTIYTDGSAYPSNPGPNGGYGVVVVDQSGKIIDYYSKQFSDGEYTNNQMELLAILDAIENFGKNSEEEVVVMSDSAYAINSLSSWGFGWREKGWIKKDGKPPENLDILKKYFDLYDKGYRISFIKVKGHSTDRYNQLADKLAKGEKISSENFNLLL